ncbi:MAG TPA: imidazole glycerol phosphate synthase cyclase subunit [Steroidobacteraceae bacterium]|jgi:cyclase|nr:imidazole glycerol phosphate synthase cyclase subunit [Steroidobacteraceae bacterium]
MSATLLKKRLVPKLLIRHRRVGLGMRPVLVTTRAYREALDVGDAVSQARIYEAQLADELIVLNIDGTPIAGDEVMLGLIERLATETFMPLAVGGGVRSVEDFALLLQRGADKVCINTAALDSPELISAAAGRFGAQCVVVSIDFRVDAAGRAMVHREHARHPLPVSVLDWARRAADAGAGELLLTDADRDGAGTGLNCDVAREVSAAVQVPVILSGGCGRAEHFVEGFQQGGAEAVAAGTFFSLRDQNPMQARAHIRNAGIPIRMET